MSNKGMKTKPFFKEMSTIPTQDLKPNYRHGLYSMLKIHVYSPEFCVLIKSDRKCKECKETSQKCIVLEKISNRLRKELTQMYPLKAPPLTHRVLIEQFIFCFQCLWIIGKHFSVSSVLEGNDVAPIMKNVLALSNSLRRWGETLGLTPKQLAELGITVGDFADRMSKVEEKKNEK